jgi:hypothetical protein
MFLVSTLGMDTTTVRPEQKSTILQALIDLEDAASCIEEFTKLPAGRAILRDARLAIADFQANPIPLFKDISTELSRQYTWSSGAKVVIHAPKSLSVSANGHRIVDGNNNGHYVPAGWIHLQWINKPNANPVVA